MHIIDDFSSSGISFSGKRGLNVLTLVALLLFNYGQSLLINLDSAHYYSSGDGFNYTYLIRVVCILAAAFISDLTGKPKLIGLIGFGILIALTLLNFTGDFLIGLPVFIFFQLGSSMVSYALLSRLIYGTAFLEKPQQTIFFSLVGVGMVTTLSFAFTNYTGTMDVEKTTYIGLAFVIGGLICLLTDKEPEVEREEPDLKGKDKSYLTNVALPLAGIALVIYWLISYTQRFYNIYHPETVKNLFPTLFMLSIVYLGLLALLILVVKPKNHWLFILIGGGLQLILFALCFSIERNSNFSFSLFLWLNWISVRLCFVGLSLWVYYNSRFKYLALLFAADEVGSFGADTVNQFFPVEMNEFSFSNF